MTNTLHDGLPLALGGNTFGWTTDDDQSFAVLDAFVDAGGTHIDTADVYSAWAEGNSGGESESVIGRWLQRTGRRDDVFLATKVGSHPKHQGLAADNVRAALQESLQRLGTDHVDLYYAHYDDESQSPDELAATFGGLVKDGLVRNIGLSNLSPEREQAWIDAATSAGVAVPVAIQPQYSLAHRADFEGGYRAIAEANGLAVFSYFSLASGLLTGKYRSKEDIAGTARASFLEASATDDAFALVTTLTEVAGRHDVEPATVALAWLLAKGVTAPIASARTPEQLAPLVASSELTLTAGDIADLDRASQPFA
ncbi:aldo/keto reductase [Nigerium massiliense]|uniref:aldo/keto reductase n=1 Tax=Nigerium massiliense TaxID=1522317 RepID=UPI00058FCE9B|nr:aldo/keto reductase [Nigerium massiliense]